MWYNITMNLNRKSGILLHPTSLPGAGGIGTLGRASFDFIDWLSDSGTKLWQVLPLGPTGYGDSPYQPFSAFALNPLLIDMEGLFEQGWAQAEDVKVPDYIKPEGNVDFGSVVWWKKTALKNICKKIIDSGLKKIKTEFDSFCQEKAFWLDDYAAFMSIKSHYDSQGMWNKVWPEDLRLCRKTAVKKWEEEHKEEILTEKLIQFFAFTQWNRLHEYARKKNVEIVGDIPIFVSADSADVWSNQSCFQLKKNGEPSVVAGVPPDYFSPTGQLWGNPLYNWKKLAEDGYGWWIERIKSTLKLVDYVRIDHFRGFDSYWAVKYGSKTAEKGRWLKGPGLSFFKAIKNALGELPLIAEDLGEITESVRQLRKKTGLPGMKILEFGFDCAEEKRGALLNAFLPHNYTDTNCVAYTGTHDNDTVQGMLNALSQENLCLVASYLEGKKTDFATACSMRTDGTLCQKMVSLCFASTAAFALVPMQDLFGFGSDCRMNTPGSACSNWAWRMRDDMLYGELAEQKGQWLKEMNCLYNR